MENNWSDSTKPYFMAYKKNTVELWDQQDLVYVKSETVLPLLSREYRNYFYFPTALS